MRRSNAKHKNADLESVLIDLVGELSKQNIIGRWSTIVSHPFGFDTEEYPNPPSEDFQQLHQEYASFQVVEMVQMR